LSFDTRLDQIALMCCAHLGQLMCASSKFNDVTLSLVTHFRLNYGGTSFKMYPVSTQWF